MRGEVAPETTSAAYDLLERSTFVTRFGGVDANHRALGRLHGLLSAPAAVDATQASDWLEDAVGWVFERGEVPLQNEGETTADARGRVLLQALEESAAARDRLRQAVQLLLASTSPTRLFTDSGVPSRAGFTRELFDRLVRRIMPEPPVRNDFARFVARLLPTEASVRWLLELTPPVRRRWQSALGIDDGPLAKWVSASVAEAMRLVAARLAALGAEENVRQSLAAGQPNPWLTLPVAVDACANGEVPLARLTQALRSAQTSLHSVEANLDHSGISIDSVFQLDLMRSLVERLGLLASALRGDEAAREVAWLALEKGMLQGVQRDRSVSALWAASTQLLARRVVERAGTTGEAYLTKTRADQHAMLSAAAGGGALTAFMVVVKFVVTWAGLPPLIDAFCISLNYAAGFVGMQFAHFALATKQPSMTAATLAASIEASDTASTRDFEPLIDQVASASRTQLAALAGNVGMVVPIAILLDGACLLLTGQHFFDEPAAAKVVKVHHPLLSGTLPYAAATGIWLWAASLVAGAVENWFVVNELPAALAGNRLLRRLMGPDRAGRLAAGLTTRISGLGGNIGFGFILGFMPFFAKLVGFPLDVRHVTFVAGQLAYAGMYRGAEGVLQYDYLSALVSVPLVGALNFAVSFSLALFVALRARGVGIGAQASLARAVLHRLVKRPKAFFFGPRV
jgi:site-specific recombinase